MVLYDGWNTFCKYPQTDVRHKKRIHSRKDWNEAVLQTVLKCARFSI